MFDPKVIFLLLWGSQVFLHSIFNESFDTFNSVTWISIILVFGAFNLGAYSIICASNTRLKNAFPMRSPSFYMKRFSTIFLIIYIIGFCFTTLKLTSAIQPLLNGDISLVNIRQVVVNDFIGDRHLNSIFKFYYFGVGCCIFLLTFSRDFSRKKVYFIILIGLISAILTTGRLYLLLFFCASTLLLHRNKIISFWTVAFSGCAFVILFFVIAILLNKGGDVGATMDSVIWNGQIYIMSSLSCFNNFVATDAQRIEGGALIPNVLRNIINLFGMSLPLKPNLLPFSEVPSPCNTYTVIFPLFHDGNLGGVFIGLFVIGAVHQFLYLNYKYSQKAIWWYLYALSLYPLVMTIFEDAYFSSPGFWFLLFLPPVLYYIYVSACLYARRLTFNI